MCLSNIKIKLVEVFQSQLIYVILPNDCLVVVVFQLFDVIETQSNFGLFMEVIVFLSPPFSQSWQDFILKVSSSCLDAFKIPRFRDFS